MLVLYGWWLLDGKCWFGILGELKIVGFMVMFVLVLGWWSVFKVERIKKCCFECIILWSYGVVGVLILFIMVLEFIFVLWLFVFV